MANDENLIPFGDRTESEHRAIATAGGIASGEARRKRKAMREQAELLLSLPFQDRINDKGESLIEKYKQLTGIEETDDLDNQMAMVVAMWQKVLGGGEGSVNAFNSLRDLVGEKPKEVIEIHSTDETIKELDKIIDEKKGKGQ